MSGERWTPVAIFEIVSGLVVVQMRGDQVLPHNPMKFDRAVDALASLGYTRFHKRKKGHTGRTKLTKTAEKIRISMDSEAFKQLSHQ